MVPGNIYKTNRTNHDQCGWSFLATRMCLISPQIFWDSTLLLRSGEDGRLQIQHQKIFFFCYQSEVRPKRYTIEEGEVMQAHIVSIKVQHSPHPFLYKRPLFSGNW